jgi:hypothetical protein
MPKGDRLRLKADPEDGTTPIANLLLEAVAMAKISGLQKGAILYLWRRTYGWQDESGNRKKEDKIPLSEWAKALDSCISRLSHALSELELKKIIKRKQADSWGGYYYSINTEVSKWDSGCLNFNKLREVVGIPTFPDVVAQNASITKNATIDQKSNSCDNDNSCPKQNGTVAQNAREQLPKTQPPTLYKEILNKDKERKDDVVIPSFVDKATWGDFLEMRKKMKATPTPRAIRLIFTQLGKLMNEGNPPNQVLEQSIMNNWKGVFPLRGGNNGTNRQNNQESRPGEDAVAKYTGGKYGHMVIR